MQDIGIEFCRSDPGLMSAPCALRSELRIERAAATEAAGLAEERGERLSALEAESAAKTEALEVQVATQAYVYLSVCLSVMSRHGTDACRGHASCAACLPVHPSASQSAHPSVCLIAAWLKRPAASLDDV
jgi:hypothetical protein